MYIVKAFTYMKTSVTIVDDSNSCQS